MVEYGIRLEVEVCPGALIFDKLKLLASGL
jgi:hypothetical protein